MGQQRTRAVLALAYAVAYVASAAALESSAFPSGFSPWYPPAGLTLAYLVLAGPSPATGLVALAVRYANTAIVFPDAWRDEPEAVLLRGLAITACYLAAAWLLRRVRMRAPGLRELGWFALVGVAGAPLAAAAAVAVVEVLVLDAAAADAFDAATTFWVGDAVAVVAIVPASLLIAASRHGWVSAPRLPSSGGGRLETFAQAAALVVIPVVAVAISRNEGDSAYLVLAVVPAVWVAVRRDLVLAVVGLLLLTGSLATSAALVLEDDVAVAELQAVLLAASLAGLYVAAANHSQDLALGDLLESEARYRSLVGSAPDLVVRLDTSGAVLFASEPAWLADAGGVDAVVGELRSRWGVVAGVLTGGAAVRALEWDQERDGVVRSFGARVGPELRADGSARSVIAVITDLTPQRLVEAERVQQQSRSVERQAAEDLLRRRLADGQVTIAYQPVVDLGTGALHAVEALARLRDADGTLVLPGRFVPVAEATGLDVELGTLVLDGVLQQLAAWGRPTLTAHVNVTARQLTRRGFARDVLDSCRRAGVAPEQLCLELTETMAMADPEAAIAALTDLRRGGVGAALDDFGTGYSSIAHLSRLPVTVLKIDRSFVMGLPDDVTSRAVIGLVVGLGASLGLEVVAEGVEREAEADALRDLGCRLAQGFLFAQPGPAEVLERMLGDLAAPPPGR